VSELIGSGNVEFLDDHFFIGKRGPELAGHIRRLESLLVQLKQ
jgi:hypothetical protein